MEKKLNKKEILKKSPHRDWNNTSKMYDRIYLIPAGTKHESGYMNIAIVGVTNGGKDNHSDETYEICGYPDDISTFFSPIPDIGFDCAVVRMDCYYPSGILQYHARGGQFYVSEALSSMDIKFVPDKK
jgi:hypothetical protein